MGNESGVYVLYSNGVPLYVGSSICMKKRVIGHMRKGLIPFDYVEFHARKKEVMLEEEQRFMDELNPPTNKRGAIGKTIEHFSPIEVGQIWIGNDGRSKKIVDIYVKKSKILRISYESHMPCGKRYRKGSDPRCFTGWLLSMRAKLDAA